MGPLPLTELTTRARDIFRLVVEEYLESGQPVGSKALAQDRGVNLSPASVRSVLSDLEQAGLLAAPHTSAGRMPTEVGLRLFIDAMMQVGEPSPAERAAIEERLKDPGPIEHALEQTSALLSDLSGAAGMVMVPQREGKLNQLSIVPLAPGRAMVVLVGEDGHVENRVIELGGEDSAASFEQASNYLTHMAQGKTLAEVLRDVASEIATERSALDTASADLVQRGLAVWSEDAANRPVLIVRGQSKLLDDSALGDIERVRSLLDDLESKQSLAALLERARKADATRIFIGSENRLFSLSGSSVIASPYKDAEGRVVGVLGVIGPTRLNYARVVPMVDFTARSLGKRIG
ncbi:heat-inducible transcriptional repressor HrcA [Qipengyuania sp. DGS5-3]|uniref:heat-inducible transcriptional repressor HrcA n=1 Tax=Qipengyuania sp. DGS5-3 TaxID=3349632 RepID=UPI0036D3BE2D